MTGEHVLFEEDIIMKNNSSIKTVVAVGIGAALFFVLGRFLRCGWFDWRCVWGNADFVFADFCFSDVFSDSLFSDVISLTCFKYKILS